VTTRVIPEIAQQLFETVIPSKAEEIDLKQHG
jgi:hypothetical protein